MSIASNIAISRNLRSIYTSILFILAPSHIFVDSKLFVLMGARMNWLALSQFFRSHSEPLVNANGRARTDKKSSCELRASLILTLEGPSTSIDVFSFRNACKMASVKSYDTILSEFYFFINTCLLSKFQDFSASGYRKKYVTT